MQTNNKTSIKIQPVQAFHKREVKAPPEVYTLNVLPFTHPSPVKEFSFTTREQPGLHRFRIEKLPKGSASLFPVLNKEKPFVYTNFDLSGEGVPIKVNLGECPAIAKAYYTLLIRQHLEKSADVVITNFHYDTQFWYKIPGDPSAHFSIYKKFTVKVQGRPGDPKPALMISYDGQTYVTAQSLEQLTERTGFHTGLLNRVIFRERTYSYDKRPDAAKYHPGEVFPVLNRKLAGALKISLPYALNSRPYETTYNNIQWFYSRYIDCDDFKKVIPHESKWLRVKPEDQIRLTNIHRELIFGEENTGTDVFEGLKAFGPLQLPQAGHIKVIMIYYRGDEEAAQKLETYLNKSDGFPNTKKLTRLPYHVDRELDIVLPKDGDPVAGFREKLFNLSLQPGCTYYAFYLSPYTKFEDDITNKQIYYRIKELLLHRGIALQTIEKGKLLKDFSYSMANIGIAMIAKLGGIPWRLSQPEEPELIIGFSAYRSQVNGAKFVGSAVCFTNEGVFRELDCFPSDETWSIAGTAEKALIRFRQNNPEVRRMVIHFYKKMSYRELKPIEEMLGSLHFDIPVIIVSINKTFGREFLAFDENFEGKMPLNGTYFHLGNHQYLFCNNDRQTTQAIPGKLPLPVKLGLQCNHEGLLDNSALVEKLIHQVYEFSFMHWRSVRQLRIPVTVTYPEMIAQILPWFESKGLPEYAKHSLFFI
jgi:hypothetical protein